MAKHSICHWHQFSSDVSEIFETLLIGSLFAGTDESPGEYIIYNGRRFKTYRESMGSIGAMKRGSKDRYFQESSDENKLVAEGIEGMVPYKGL